MISFFLVLFFFFVNIVRKKHFLSPVAPPSQHHRRPTRVSSSCSFWTVQPSKLCWPPPFDISVFFLFILNFMNQLLKEARGVVD